LEIEWNGQKVKGSPILTLWMTLCNVHMEFACEGMIVLTSKVEEKAAKV